MTALRTILALSYRWRVIGCRGIPACLPAVGDEICAMVPGSNPLVRMGPTARTGAGKGVRSPTEAMGSRSNHLTSFLPFHLPRGSEGKEGFPSVSSVSPLPGGSSSFIWLLGWFHALGSFRAEGTKPKVSAFAFPASVRNGSRRKFSFLRAESILSHWPLGFPESGQSSAAAAF